MSDQYQPVPPPEPQPPAAPAQAPPTQAPPTPGWPPAAGWAPAPGWPGQAPPGPYPAYPAWPGAPGYPAAAPAPARPVNGFAIASLVFGVVGVGLLLGLVCGFVALRQIGRRAASGRREGGRGLAIAGIVASGFWLLVVTIVAAAMIAGGGLAGGGGHGSALAPGDCLRTVGTSGSVADVPVVSCSARHEGEVFAVFALQDGPWPGDASVAQAADARCNEEFAKYATSAASKMDIVYVTPRQDTWSLDRTVTCIARDPAGPSTGSIRK